MVLGKKNKTNYVLGRHMLVELFPFFFFFFMGIKMNTRNIGLGKKNTREKNQYLIWYKKGFRC